MMPRPARAASVSVALLLALAACGRGGGGDGNQVDALDRELVGNAAGDQTDPALTNALADQIMVDPALTQQKVGAAPRPGATPAQAPIPATPPVPGGPAGADAGLAKAPPPTPTKAPSGATLGELARRNAPPARPGGNNCIRNLQYSAAWAQRLPANLPLYPDAQVREAAGNDAPGCAMRIVSFVSGARLDRLVDFYFTHARRAGFAAEHQVSGADHIVAGERGEGAFYATLHPQADGGTQVDLVVNDIR